MKTSILPVLLVIAILTSCDEKHKGPAISAEKETISELAPASPEVATGSGDVNAEIRIDEPVGNVPLKTAANDAAVEKKIVKQGSISFKTQNLGQTKKRVYAALKAAGGYIEQENQQNNNYENNRSEYTLEVRIPAEKFEKFQIDIISKGDSLESKNISVKDVTTQYIDINTRLANKKALEKRYLELLGKANKMTDMLEIESKLNDIRSDIESTQGQFNYLNKQIAYSALTITFFTETAKADLPTGTPNKFLNALITGWHWAINWFFYIVSLWPFWILLSAVIIVIKRWRKRKVHVE